MNLACLALLQLLAFQTTPSFGHQPRPPIRIANTALAGQAAPDAEAGGRSLAFLVPEVLQGGADLNGDGDADDSVLHVYDHGSGATRNVGVLPDGFRPHGRYVVFRRLEVYAGVDLNQDGDVLDSVVQVVDSATGAVRNLGLASFGFEQPGDPDFLEGFQVGGDLLVFAVSEYMQGNADLNGDGDTIDWVLHVHDLRKDETVNLGLAVDATVQVAATDGRWTAVPVKEAAQGADLNGDGDELDTVLFVHDAVLGTVGSPGISLHPYLVGMNPGTRMRVNRGRAAFLVYEAMEGGTDLNGDGDAADYVLCVLAAATGQLDVLGALFSEKTPAAPGTFSLADGIVAFGLSEGGEGLVDLNLDGDTSDAVLHVYDAGSGVVWNTQLAADFLANEEISLSGNAVAFLVDESGQRQDLNGDGDQLDHVAHLLDVAAGSVASTGRAAQELSLSSADGVLALVVLETQEGFRDLNGDGDVSDWVLHLASVPGGATTNLGLALDTPNVAWPGGPSIHLRGGHLLFSVSEWDQGQADLNGDGDHTDPVVHSMDLGTGAVWNHGLVAASNMVVGRRFVAVSVSEADNGTGDLNGDGDATDDVVHVVDLFP